MKKLIFSLFALTLCACSHPSPRRSLASIDDQMKRIDKSRKTVCTVTLNSDEEKDVFRAHLKGFNMVELADTKDSNWLQSACEKKVECDILLVSGHFAGTFFGKSGLKLPLAKMESLSCSSGCPGIFEHPKEVFLMGCNTLAGKTKDRRTPEEYVRVLMADGFSRQQAEQVAAARYSVIGSSIAARMRMSFPAPHTKLYGFDSIGPSGANVKPLLERYISSVPDYNAYLTDWNPGLKNAKLAEALKVTSFAEVLPAKTRPNNPACVLNSQRPISQKLTWINQVLNDDHYALAYVPNIMQYFNDLNKSFRKDWPEAEASYLETIQANQAAKTRLLKLTEKPMTGILSQQAEILNFARSVGWINDRQYGAHAKALVGDFFRQNLTLEQKDSICSSEVHLNLSKQDLPKERWNEHTVEAIGCLHSRGEGVEAALIDALQKPDVPVTVRSRALDALGNLGPLSVSTQEKMVKLFKNKDESISLSAMEGLGAAGTTIDSAHQAYISFLKEDSQQGYAAIKGLANSRSLSPALERKLLDLIGDPDITMEQYRIFGPRQIASPAGQKVFFRLLKEGEPEVRAKATWIAAEAGWEVTPELKKIITQNLAHPDEHVRGVSGLYFTQENRAAYTQDVEDMALNLLRNSKGEVKADLISFLSQREDGIRPATQEEILNGLSDRDEKIRVAAVYASRDFCQRNASVYPLLQKMTEDPVEYVRNALKGALKVCAPAR